MFSGNLPMDIAHILFMVKSFPPVEQCLKYLGYPFIKNGRHVNILNKLLLDTQSWTSTWQHKSLSQMGRAVMIKFVLLALPTYIMSCYKVSKGICAKLQTLLALFWKNQGSRSNRAAWDSWDHLCLDKRHGGLGFKYLDLFNQALLAKQRWHILTQPISLSFLVLKENYFPRSNFLKASKGINPSYIWTNILWGRQLLLQGFGWKIGSGDKIHVWLDNWIPAASYFKPMFSYSHLGPHLKVSQLIDGQSRTWDRNVLALYFHPMDIKCIIAIHLPLEPMEDYMIWMPDKTHNVSVRTTYEFAIKCLLNAKSKPSISSVSIPHKFWKFIWSKGFPPRFSLWLWRAVRNRLPTKLNLLKKPVTVNSFWCFCSSTAESLIHLLC